MPDDSGMDAVLDKITDMPVLPTVLARLIHLIGDSRTTASAINTVLSADPGLVMKILKLVNSAYYGFSRRITTITNAVVILGFNQVRNLALSAFILDRFTGRKGKGAALDVNRLWRHLIGTAFLSARISRTIDPKMVEDAFVCGLLHDLGKFIMALHVPGNLTKVMEIANLEDISFAAAEAKALPYNHAVLGARVMERWNLPGILVDVVRHHHNPLEAPENSRTLCAVTRTADIVARALLMGNAGDNRIPRLEPEVWEMTGLDWNGLEDIIRKVAEEYSKSDAFFSIS